MSILINFLIRLYQTTFGIYAAPTIVTGTSPVACQGICFTAVSDCDVASITINGTAITDFSGITLSQGFTIYGLITSVTLTSGTGIVYSGNNNVPQ